MHVLKHSLAASLLLIAPQLSWAASSPDLGERLARDYVRPAFTQLAQASTSMQKTLGAWCAKPDAAGSGHVKEAFTQLALAWSGVEFLRFGPLVQANRYERLAFWPDTRGVMPRQVQALLSAQDEAALAPGALASRSVAVQGLPALEFVLYGEPALLNTMAAPTFAYQCQYALALASNVSDISKDLVLAWSEQSDFGRQFTTPLPENDLYRTQQEVAAESIKALSTGLQFARDIKLLPVLGDKPDAARPKRAAFWRSGLTTRTLAAGLTSMRAFYIAADYKLPAGGEWIDTSVRSELARAAADLSTMSLPLDQVLAQAEGRRQLELAALTIKNAKAIVDQDLAPALGVTIGFNALDGD